MELRKGCTVRCLPLNLCIIIVSTYTCACTEGQPSWTSLSSSQIRSKIWALLKSHAKLPLISAGTRFHPKTLMDKRSSLLLLNSNKKCRLAGTATLISTLMPDANVFHFGENVQIETSSSFNISSWIKKQLNDEPTNFLSARTIYGRFL